MTPRFGIFADMDEKFGKEYKLCSKKVIDSLFKDGLTHKTYPFVAHFRLTELPTSKNFQVTISVPKRIFKHAHDRNRIKRLIREAIRKNKLILEEHLLEKNHQLALFLVYRHQEEPKYEDLLAKTKKLFLALIEKIDT